MSGGRTSGDRAVVIDVNFLSRLYRIDGDCDLVDFICDAFDGQPVGDGPQLERISYCASAAANMRRHDVTDAEVVEVIQDRSDVDFTLTMSDPVDARLLVYTQREGGVLLTCDTGLLTLAHQLRVEHWCFKAALWETDTAWGGAISDSADYATEAMEDPGTDPYFHSACCKRCPECDPGRRCRHGHIDS